MILVHSHGHNYKNKIEAMGNYLQNKLMVYHTS